MGKTRTLLELYGSLDKAVRESDGPEIAAAVDQLLPGASANKGWYREIEHFFFGPEGAKNDPDPIEALKRIAQEDQRLKDYEKLRLLYGIAALARVQNVPAIGPLPHLKEEPAMKDAVTGALAVLRKGGAPYDKRKAATEKSYDEIIGHLETTTGRRAWPKITKKSVKNDWVDEGVEQAPLCGTSVVTVDGFQCVVVDTEFSSDAVSLNEVKAIADPRNWDEDYHEFFCQIEQLPARPDGWGRFLETVGFCGEDGGEDALELVTQLKYYKSTPSETEAHLDYDLDDPTPGDGDGRVKVDRGFINMRPSGDDPDTKDPDTKGVRVRIRKVVHIEGLLPAAQARLVCVSGYGTAAREMLLGAAERAKTDRTFEPVPWDTPVSAPDTSGQGDTEPAEPISYIATAAVKVWADAADEIMTRSFDMSDKWLDGALNFNDLANYSKDVGGLLLRAPWEFLQALNQPRYPGGRSNQKPQGGGT
jgi:hypothetical protein